MASLTNTKTSPSVQISLAAFPGMRHEDAAARAAREHTSGELCEPCWGVISVDHVQLVPQNLGQLRDEVIESLLGSFPGTRFRLHANVRVLPEHRVADLSGFDEHTDWFNAASRVSQSLRAPAYTAHAGRRSQASLAEALDNTRRAADLFGCPVGIEGHYPTPRDEFLVSSWSEYRRVFDSGVPYALDLSHLNIVARHSGQNETALVQDMLSSPQCIEVHVSDNDGRRDAHQVCEERTWWHDLLPFIHSDAVVFTEGNQRTKLCGVQKHGSI
jgi:hypothetical protein